LRAGRQDGAGKTSRIRSSNGDWIELTVVTVQLEIGLIFLAVVRNKRGGFELRRAYDFTVGFFRVATPCSRALWKSE
jgi:hypothetical protein